MRDPGLLSFLRPYGATAGAHGWLAGSDASEAWMHGVYESAVGLVGFLVLMRLVSRRPATAPPAPADGAGGRET